MSKTSPPTNNASEKCSEANEQYVNENYQKAIELYTDAISLDDKRDDILCHRAQAYLQLEQYEDAVNDLERAIQINAGNSKAFLRKGITLFKMDEVGKALDTFKAGRENFGDDKNFDDWIEKCNKKLGVEAPVAEAAATTVIAPVKVKHDWYQTHTHVIVTVLAKGVKKENLKVDVEERQLKVLIKDYNGSDVNIDLNLAHKVVAEQTQMKIFGSKIEVKLKKTEGVQWEKLEGVAESETTVMPAAAAPSSAEISRYPSSSHYTRDWDKLEAEVKEEEKNEKLDGDAGLNKFFQNLYADASDETKKAMMKSFSESGGTVLSTNWSEVGSKKVEVKPPDGMEYKKWEY